MQLFGLKLVFRLGASLLFLGGAAIFIFSTSLYYDIAGVAMIIESGLIGYAVNNSG